MSENSIEPEVLPSTSQNDDVHKKAIFPLVSLPKIVLTRLDLDNLPAPVYKGPSPVKKAVKRLLVKKNKPIATKSLQNKTNSDVKHISRFRNKPKKDYKTLSEVGMSPTNITKTPTPTGKSGVVKKVPKSVIKQKDSPVKGMLNKTMLQKRSKISIPSANKTKLIPKKSPSTNVSLKSKKEKPSVASTPKKETLTKVKNDSFKIDTDASEDEFLYDELIDELVNPPNKKSKANEKTTNITLKPNVGNKPPTIVKGGIVKKSNLPPDLKSVTSPATLNSSRLAGTALNPKSKTTSVENTIQTPATAETPKANLPNKSPSPIASQSSPFQSEPNNQEKKGEKRSANDMLDLQEDPPLNVNPVGASNTPTKISPKPKPATPAPRPTRPRGRPKMGPKTPIMLPVNLNVAAAKSIERTRGKPRIGPKQAIKPSLNLNTAAGEESDEYTEVETLENIDSEPVEVLGGADKSRISGDIKNPYDTNESDTGISKVCPKIESKLDGDPHLDLLRILTDDTEDTQTDANEINTTGSENPHDNIGDSPKPNLPAAPDPTNDKEACSFDGSNISDTLNSVDQAERSTEPQTTETTELTSMQVEEEPLENLKTERKVPPETVEEATPQVRTIYDLMREVSLQYPSWNLHILPETSAFCISQVTKGRLGLPTLKKCIELDPDTYFAKVYIHRCHIKKFDGIYDSEDAILALIEEIHAIKA